MSNPAFKPSEGKREEFRTYLEKNGVMDALTKVLVNLYEEADKPEDALEYIRDKLASQAGLETHSQMKRQVDESLAKVEDLTKELEALKASADLQPPAQDQEMAAPPEESPAEGETIEETPALEEPAAEEPKPAEKAE